MTPQIVFKIANSMALTAWIFLILAPRFKGTVKIVKSGLVSLVLSLFYIGALSLSYRIFFEGGGFNSLKELATLFSNEWALLAGWVHYLAFDLLIGVMAAEKLRNRNAIIRSICLFLIFMFGPIGWLLMKGLTYNNEVQGV